MKKQFIYYLLLIWLALMGTTSLALAQAPAWQMAVAVGLSSAGASSAVWGTALGPAGDVYVVGGFDGTASFGPHTLTSIGNVDIFVAKWSPTTAQFVWAQQAGGTGNDAAYAVAISGNSIYLTGSFSGTGAHFGATTLSTSGNNTPFVAKLIDAGSSSTFGWARQAVTTSTSAAKAIAVSGTSVYIAGDFIGSVQLGSIVLASADPVSNDMFVAKLTDTGPSASFEWAHRGGGPALEQVYDIAVSGPSVYLTGVFLSTTATFGSISLSNRGNADAYMAKLTDAGTSAAFTWVQHWGGTANDAATTVAVVGNEVYVAGYFSGTATFGTVSLTASGATSVSGDLLIAKLTDAGSSSRLVWTQQAAGQSSAAANALAVSGPDIYLTGNFRGTMATFGTTTLSTTGNTSKLFLTRLLDTGSAARFVWAQEAGSLNGNRGSAVAVTSGGTVYVGGQITPDASFGPHTITGTMNNSLGFLASVNASPLTTTPPADLATRLYPNPAHGTVTVPLPTGLTTLTLLDALGRAVRVQTATGPRTVLPLMGLPAGVYAVRLTTGSTSTTQRLVVE